MTSPIRRASSPLACLVLAALVGACGSGPTPSPAASAAPSAAPTASPPSATAAPSTPAPSATAAGSFDPTGLTLGLEPVVGGLDSPLAVTHAGDGSGRIFVAEQGGTIRIVRDGQLIETPFLDISDRLTSGGERGLLGLAFHPDYPADPRFFVNYTDPNGDTVISSFGVDPGDPDRADPASELALMTFDQPYSNHNGGALAFGLDGYLLIATGDGGSGGDPHGNGQALDTALGKILRIDVNGTEGAHRYAIPPDNPFADGDRAAREIFAYGLRNPWRMSIDRATGDLWIGDVGQGAWEEVDVIRTGTSGQNFGWNRMEGAHCFRPAEGCEDPSYVLPVTEYTRDAGSTIIGGVVYRGSAQPRLVGGYVFADFGSGNVWVIDAATDGPTDPILVLEGASSISSFGEDEAGEVYATDLRTGELVRVVANP